MAADHVLSDGEILSSEKEDEQDMQSNESKGEKIEDGWTVVDKRTARKRKNSRQLLEENAKRSIGDSSASNKAKPKKKKRNRTSEKNSAASTPQRPSGVPNDQKLLLRMTCDIVSQVQDYRDCVHRFKTNDFQAIIRFLVLGEPAYLQTTDIALKTDTLRQKRILVIWMSCVSKSDFILTDDRFKRLKALQPSVKFTIGHPGSDTFVKMGLEAFLDVSDSFPPKKPFSQTLNIPQQNFTKRHCLLTLQDLIENEYPHPSEDNNQSTDNMESTSNCLPHDYFQLTTWPNDIEFVNDVSKYSLFSIDCEMVGIEGDRDALARISVIDEDLECVYSKIVQPSETVLNYRTKYSGMTPQMLEGVTVTLQDVQQDLKQLLPANCILVGHSLECDLRVIKMYHPYVIDTSLLFTPNASPRNKPSLKNVTKKILDIDIQVSTEGHDPTEDAMACMRLVKKKLEEGAMLQFPWRDDKTSLFDLFHQNSIPVAMVDKKSIVSLFARDLSEGVVVESDEEAVSQAKELILDSQFTFVQLHGMEKMYKQNNCDKSTYEKELDSLDSHVCELISSTCQGTLVFVVCGSSYIGDVRRLQTAVPQDIAALKEEVKKARTGYVITVLK